LCSDPKRHETNIALTMSTIPSFSFSTNRSRQIPGPPGAFRDMLTMSSTEDHEHRAACQQYEKIPNGACNVR
jgi:hypothetical protein